MGPDPGHWILVNGLPTRVPLLKLGEVLKSPERVVAQTEVDVIPWLHIQVSTVFLGLDHNFSGIGPPVLWETMIFGGKHDGAQWRYSSRAAAEAGHLDAVEIARGVRVPC